MGGLFGSADSVDISAPVIGTVRLQTSSAGRPIPICYGLNRLAGNLIWYDDFKAIPHTSTQGGGGKGGGGGGSTQTTYTYKSSVVMGLCEGEIAGVNIIWSDKKQTTAEKLALSIYTGSKTQDAFPYITTNHPEAALCYRSLAYVASGAYDLGDHANFPNHNFEVHGMLSYSGSIVDANPKDVLLDFLTNPTHGAGYPSSFIDNWTMWSNYCIASGIFISPVITEQAAAAEILEKLCNMTNAAIVYSEGKLKILCYADRVVTGNGVTYTPNLTPVYDLTDDDFLSNGDDDSIVVHRGNSADFYNQVQVKFSNRDNEYSEDIATVTDQASIELFGLRPMEPITALGICKASIASLVAHNILQRIQGIRNTYRFKLGMKFALLEPMDFVTLTEDDPNGLQNVPVRIIAIEEDEDSQLDITAEDAPLGIGHGVIYPNQPKLGYAVDYNVIPGFVAPPVIFERKRNESLIVSIAVTGESSFWGGCQIWYSENDETYKILGKTNGEARYGKITNSTGSSESDHFDVLLSGMGGQLLSATSNEASLYATECLVGSEFVAYEVATLLGANNYRLSNLRRGGNGTVPIAHFANDSFVRVDKAIIDTDPVNIYLIGKTIYFKFLSYNTWGGAIQGLEDVESYAFFVEGKGAIATTASFNIEESLMVAAGAVVSKINVSWTSSSEYLYAIVRWRINGGNWTLLPNVYASFCEIITSESGLLDVSIVSHGLVDSEPVFLNKNLLGKTSPPQSVLGFNLTVADRQAFLFWNPTLDLDVIVGGWLWVKHSAETEGATWGNANNLIVSVPGTAVSTLAAMQEGTYLAKWVDSSGNESVNAATFILYGNSIPPFNIVVMQGEDPTWTGTKVNVVKVSDHITLVDPTQNASYTTSVIDLGSVASTRISTVLKFSGYFSSEVIDERTTPIDQWATVDGTSAERFLTEILFRATQDDPTGSPVWTDWTGIKLVTQYKARAFQFELRLVSTDPDCNLDVFTFTTEISVLDRTDIGSTLTSGAGAYNIAFATPFFYMPSISISAHNMQTGDYYVISSKALTGFTVTFKNAAGTSVSRIFDWTAKGY